MKQVPALEPGAMCYMMSRDGNPGDSQGHWHPHLMFYGPRSEAADWGSDLPGSPVYLNPQFRTPPSRQAHSRWLWADGRTERRRTNASGKIDAFRRRQPTILNICLGQ
jgi:hypothetical protein